MSNVEESSEITTLEVTGMDSDKVSDNQEYRPHYQNIKKIKKILILK